MKLLGTPLAIQSITMATQKHEPKAQLLDDDQELYDEIKDMEINDVINGYMDDEVIDEIEAKLDPDYELYDEISDMEINDVINGYMDDEIVNREYFMESAGVG